MNGTPCKVYSRRMDGEKKISPNFRVREFACRDGADPVIIADKLVNVLQAIRSHFGQPVTVTSGFRTESHNAAVRGVSRSLHLYGMAADIQVAGVSPAAVADYAETLLPDSGGVGRYADFTHVDIRKEKTRFTG